MNKDKLKLKPVIKKKIEYSSCKSCGGCTPVYDLRFDYCPTCIYWDGVIRRNEEIKSTLLINNSPLDNG